MKTPDSKILDDINVHTNNSLSFVPLGIDTQLEYFVFVKANSTVVISEGYETLTRLLVGHEDRTIVATLSTIESDLIKDEEVSLSISASSKLGVSPGGKLKLSHLPPITSLSIVRSKIYGNKLSETDFTKIIQDIELGKYSNVHTASFLTACCGENLDIEEVTHLTKSMVGTGEVLDWGQDIVADKHCIGGLPGNRTTPIVVALVAAAGLTIPKTSSRAITSPAGTADTMDTMAPVNLTIGKIREVIEKENGCIAWGSAAGLSPVDDVIIKVERALNIDSEGQMIASILSKKVAVGSTHVVIDIPVGPTAKVRTEAKAQRLKYKLTVIGKAVGLNVKVIITDGSQPIGRGIGPALEAKDVISVLQNKPDAPMDLLQRSLLLTSSILELAGKCDLGKGEEMAHKLLSSGAGWDKFYAICQAQGGFKEVPDAPYKHRVLAKQSGIISAIDNRKLAQVAKLAGAPYDPAAGLKMFVKCNDVIEQGQPLYCIHSESEGELKYALRFVETDQSTFEIV